MKISSKLLKSMVVIGALWGLVGHAQAADSNAEHKLIQLILNAKSPEVFLYSPEKPFTLKSGKVSPIFINMGNISSGEAISRLGDIYADAIVNNKMEFDVVYGSAYKGIPLSVTIARSLYQKTGKNYPYVYNRKEVKDHGEGGLLVGVDLKGKKVLIVDDVITTGKDKIESMEMIAQAGGKVVGVIVSVDRREDKTPLPGKIPVVAITTLDNLIQAKQKQNSLAQRQPAEIIVPLDVDNMKQANEIVAQLDPKLCKVKVGLQLFTAEGPKVVKHLRAKGFEVFLDLKYMDIPNTVYNAVYQAAELDVFMLTVHTLGSDEMMAQARQALIDFNGKHPQKRLPLIVGVTILTSVSDAELKDTFKFADMQDAVLKLASKANKYKLDGIVCSPNEAEMIRSHSKEFAANFVIVTPGIRLDDNKQDQVRVATPEVAVKAGSNYLVVGRPITQAKDPKAALQMFVKSIHNATVSVG